MFPLRADAYSQMAFGRRCGGECAVATPEDTILRKLESYRAGGETSQRQWDDLRGVCAAARERLDADYLREWAGELKVADLLEELLAEFGM